MVVELFLLEPFAQFLIIEKGRSLFEGFYEPQQVACGFEPLGEDVQVIRHYTESVYAKAKGFSLFPKAIDQPPGSVVVRKHSPALLAAQSDEKPATPPVVLRWKTNVLALEPH